MSVSETREAADVLNALKHRYAKFCEGPLMSYEKALNEFSELCQIPGIEKLAFAQTEDGNEALILETEHIYLHDKSRGKECDIGRFAIVVVRRPQTSVQFFNLTRTVNSGGHHPHVSSDGHICSTNSDLMNGSVGAGKVVLFAYMAMQALRTYGPGAPMHGLPHWPLREDAVERM